MISLDKKKRYIYLDYASSTPVDEAVFSVYMKYTQELYANPHSLHHDGVFAASILSTSRTQVAYSIGALAKEIFFVGSATESDNLAIRGVISHARRDEVFQSYEKLHVIVSSIEHAAVLETVKELERKGIIEVDYIPVSKDGVILISEFKKLLRMNTVFVSVMHVNNEIGSIQPIAEIVKTIRHARKNNRTTGMYPYFHTDASQSPNLFHIDVEKLGVDLLTCSSAKIYGPKGVGVLYKKRTVEIDPIIFGGGQEFGLRSGTENVPAIGAFACALQKAKQIANTEHSRVTILRDFFIGKILQKFPHIIFHGSPSTNSPGIISFTIPDVESDMLVLYLDARGFAVSSKSACHTDTDELSHVLTAMYGDRARSIGGTVRVSVGRYTSEQDLEHLIEALSDILSLLTKNK